MAVLLIDLLLLFLFLIFPDIKLVPGTFVAENR